MMESHHHIEGLHFPPTLKGVFEKLGWTESGKEPQFAGKGEEASVWHLSKEGFTVRIPRSDIDTPQQQKSNQSFYFFGMIGGYLAKRIPSYIRVPYIWNDDTMKTPEIPEGVIVMQTIHGATLERTLITLDLKKRGLIFTEDDIADLSDYELSKKYYPQNPTIFRFFPTEKAIKQIFGSEISNDFMNTLSFLTKNGLIHNDIHNSNIMIVPDKKNPRLSFIYIIDFGKTRIDFSKASHLISEGKSGYTDPQTFASIWEEPGIPLKQ